MGLVAFELKKVSKKLFTQRNVHVLNNPRSLWMGWVILNTQGEGKGTSRSSPRSSAVQCSNRSCLTIIHLLLSTTVCQCIILIKVLCILNAFHGSFH